MTKFSWKRAASASALALAATLAVAGCNNNKSDNDDNRDNRDNRGQPYSLQGGRAQTYGDGDIIAIVTGVNQSEIDAAQLAQDRANSERVREFARMMIRDHQDSNLKLSRMSRDNRDLNPTSNQTADQLSDKSRHTMEKLRGLSGRAFDVAYINDQVDGHAMVLQMLDRDLIPRAQNSKLKSDLQDTRKTVAEHLHMAERVKADIGA